MNIKALVRTLSLEPKVLVACEESCRALASITLNAAQDKNVELQCQLLDLEVSEILIEVMTVHGAESSIISSYGCQVT